MKYIISTIITLFFLIPYTYANNGMDTMYVEIGQGYHLSSSDSNTLLTPVLTLGLRHNFYNNAFVQLRMDTWSKENHSAMWFGPSVGYRHDTENKRFFTEGSLGYGYLTNPDGRYSDGKGALTTNHQFEITLGTGVYVGADSEMTFGIAHLSNCAKICNRGEDFAPNPGKNWVRLSYGIHF